MRGTSFILPLALLFAARAAYAQEATKVSCVEAFDEAQRLRDQVRLLAAQARLFACGNGACPDAIRTKCVEWSEQVRSAG